MQVPEFRIVYSEKDKEKIVGLKVHPQGDAEWEDFFRKFPKWLSEGNASIGVRNQRIYFEFLNTPHISFPLNYKDALDLKDILSKLGKKYQGKAELGGFGSKSLILSFSAKDPTKDIIPGFERFNNRALAKSKKSKSYISCTEPKKRS